MKISRRRFLGSSLALGAAFTFPAPALIARGANDKIRLGSISCGGRANELLRGFSSLNEVDVVALCDPDSERLNKTAKKYSVTKTFTDPRRLIDEKELDAVIVATCNHWHCLAAVWAMTAGKDVYVEKPLAHNQFEGAQTVKAARKYGRICQVGMQQRSDPMQAEIKKFLYEEKGIGKILKARVNHYSVRNPIGKLTEPLVIPPTVDWNLWLGPAEDRPLFRKRLQYDWHWDWNTGNGEMGNWGVHVLDDMRNNVLRDQGPLPKAVTGGGARVVYDDAGQTPNVHFICFETDGIPVVFGLSTLQEKDKPKSAGKHPGPGSGYIAYCEGGRLEGQRGHAAAFDADGKLIREFNGSGGQADHIRNFVDAVLKQDASILNAEVAVGNDSCGWCNLANIAFRAGRPYNKSDALASEPADGLWAEQIEEAEERMAAYGVDMSKEFKFSPRLEYDQKAARFIGEGSDEANSFLKRTYRKGFEFPEVK